MTDIHFFTTNLPHEKAFLKSGRPLLLGSGVLEEVVNHLQHHASLEIKAASTPGYVRVQRTYARKKQS